MTLADVVVLVVLVIICAIILRGMFKRKGGGCCGGCKGCSGSGECTVKKKIMIEYEGGISNLLRKSMII